MLTSWLLGLFAGYLVLKESTLLLRQVRNSGLNRQSTHNSLNLNKVLVDVELDRVSLDPPV